MLRATTLLLILTIGSVLATASEWLARRRVRGITAPYSLLKIHVPELTGARNPDMSLTFLPLYTALPPPPQTSTPTTASRPVSWFYIEWNITGFDLSRMRGELMKLPPGQQFLVLACRSGGAVRHPLTGATSTLHFSYVPPDLQMISRSTVNDCIANWRRILTSHPFTRKRGTDRGKDPQDPA